jgi:hypothetical protein
MAITLADVQKNIQDGVVSLVIDEFRKQNFLLDRLTFDDAVSPLGGGATWTYGYTRVTTQATAEGRAIGSDYTAQEAKKDRYTTDLKILGGSYSIDRALAATGGIVSEVEFQQAQKIKAVQALFNDWAINGDSGADAKQFDGLAKILTGSGTEFNTTTAIDLSTGANITTNAQAFLDLLDAFIKTLDGQPTALMGNSAVMMKIRAVARRAAVYNITKDTWGQQVEAYGPIPLIDLGDKPGSTNPVVPTVNGETVLYAARLGLDGFHGVSFAGQPPIKVITPDFGRSEAVQTGAVEMIASVALKATKAAAVFKKIKVA